MMKYWLFQLLKIPDNMELIKLSAQKAKMEIYRPKILSKYNSVHLFQRQESCWVVEIQAC